ncbi:MAG: hypothetical protein ACLR02_09715 [Clostridium sp.]
MKKYIDFDFVAFQRELLKKSPFNLIVNPDFPNYRLFEENGLYNYERDGKPSAQKCRDINTAIEKMKASFIGDVERDNNSLGAQKADLIEDSLIKKYPEYGFYCPYDIENGVEIQITKYEEIDEDGEAFILNPSIWVTQNGPVAIKYLTNFMPFDMAIDIIKILTEICQSRISMTYKGKKLLCYENGVSV